MRRVAQGAGVTTMATYRHFANRQALLDELARREFAQLATDPAAKLGRQSGPNRARQGDAHLNLVLNGRDPRPPLVHRTPRGCSLNIRPTCGRAVADAQRAGRGPPRARRRGDLSFEDEWKLRLSPPTPWPRAAAARWPDQPRGGGFPQLCARAVGVILNGLARNGGAGISAQRSWA